jgi:hypothetical protein
MYNLLHRIAWGKPAPKRRKATLVMSSAAWKQWVAEMYEQFPADVAAKAIATTAKYQHLQ